MTEPTPQLRTSRHHLEWDMRGLVALLEELQEATFEELLNATPQGQHALRHLIKKAKKRGLIEIPVIRDDKHCFQISNYHLTQLVLIRPYLTAEDYEPKPDDTDDLAA